MLNNSADLASPRPQPQVHIFIKRLGPFLQNSWLMTVSCAFWSMGFRQEIVHRGSTGASSASLVVLLAGRVFQTGVPKVAPVFGDRARIKVMVKLC